MGRPTLANSGRFDRLSPTAAHADGGSPAFAATAADAHFVVLVEVALDIAGVAPLATANRGPQKPANPNRRVRWRPTRLPGEGGEVRFQAVRPAPAEGR